MSTRESRIRTFACSSVIVAAAAAGLACTFGFPGLPGTGGTTLVTITTTDTAVLAALARGFSQKSGDDFVLDDFEGLKDAIADTQAVVADASKLTTQAVSQNPIFKAAQDVGTPIVLDNVTDPEVMAAALGIGIPPSGPGTLSRKGINAQSQGSTLTVLAEPSNNGHEVHLTILGLSGNEQLSPSENMTPPGADRHRPDHTDPSPPPEEPGVGQKAPENQPSQPGTELTDPDAKAAFLANRINSRSRRVILADKQRYQQQSTVPSGVAYRVWTVDFSSSGAGWSPGGKNQGAFIEIDFRIELYDSAPNPGPDNKFLRITTVGPGASPGTLTWDSGDDRGYYQDRVEVEFGPTDFQSGWSVEQSAPANDNNQNSLSSTTGFTVGFSAGADTMGPMAGVSGSYSASQTITTNLTDFQVLNQTNTLRGRWDFRMSAIGGNTYNFDSITKDAIKENCNVKIRELPNLAKNLLKPNCQVVWRAPGNFQGNVPFRFYMKHTMTDLWISKRNWFICVVRYEWTWRRYWRSREWNPFYINFASVNNP